MMKGLDATGGSMMLSIFRKRKKSKLSNEPPLWAYGAIKQVCHTLHIKTDEEREQERQVKRKNDLKKLLAIRGNLDAISTKSTHEK